MGVCKKVVVNVVTSKKPTSLGLFTYKILAALYLLIYGLIVTSEKVTYSEAGGLITIVGVSSLNDSIDGNKEINVGNKNVYVVVRAEEIQAKAIT